jgi:CBS domain-containing protein
MTVADILSTKGAGVTTVHPGQSVRDAARLLADHAIGALVVADVTDRPVGIITERHIVRRLAQDDQVAARTVGEVMTARLVTGTPDDALVSVAFVMAERRIRHLPILNKGQLIGIVSVGDILKAQRDRYRGEADTLETRILNG